MRRSLEVVMFLGPGVAGWAMHSFPLTIGLLGASWVLHTTVVRRCC